MYIVNADVLPLNGDEIYRCGALIASYLVFQCGISMLGKSEKDGKYLFIKNEQLEKALEQMPYWYNIDYAI